MPFAALTARWVRCRVVVWPQRCWVSAAGSHAKWSPSCVGEDLRKFVFCGVGADNKKVTSGGEWLVCLSVAVQHPVLFDSDHVAVRASVDVCFSQRASNEFTMDSVASLKFATYTYFPSNVIAWGVSPTVTVSTTELSDAPTMKTSLGSHPDSN